MRILLLVKILILLFLPTGLQAQELPDRRTVLQQLPGGVIHADIFKELNFSCLKLIRTFTVARIRSKNQVELLEKGQRCALLITWKRTSQNMITSCRLTYTITCLGRITLAPRTLLT